MLLTRTPLRISLGGGGTDLPSYYRPFGGRVLSATIDKYVYVGINRTFSGEDYVLKHSELERVRSVSEIDHGIIREALMLHPVGPSIEIVSSADVPGGVGLGSSGTFTVGLLRALHACEGRQVAAGALAEEACAIEIERLGRPVGKQDQYAAAFGGVACCEFRPDDTVRVSPPHIANETLRDLEERLLLFFTGRSRSAAAILADQKSRSEQQDAAVLENLHAISRIGDRTLRALEAGEMREFGELLHEHWNLKRTRSPNMTSPEIDRWYQVGMDNGALGGKLVGAGGGGFLLFYARDPAALRAAMSREGLEELPFAFDHTGSTVVFRG